MSLQQPAQKLLVLTSTYPRWEKDTEPKFVYYLSQELAKSFDTHVLAPHYPGAARQEFHGDVKVHRFRYAPDAIEHLTYNGGILPNLKRDRWKWLLVPLFLGLQLLQMLSLQRRYRFDAVHCHWLIPQGVLVSIFKLFYPKVRILTTSHGGDLYGLQGSAFNAVKRWVIRQSNSISVVSEAMKQSVYEQQLTSGPVQVRSMGVDLQHHFTLPPENTERDGLVFVGRLVEKKGVSYLIEAIALLKQQGRPAKLTSVGDGPDKPQLELQARQLQLDDCIHFT